MGKRQTGHLHNARGMTTLRHPGGVYAPDVGLPVLALRRLHLSQFTGYDPGTRLASAVTDGGEDTGWSVALTGGLAAITDPLDGAYFVGTLSSLFGTKLSATTMYWSYWLQIMERTGPGLSTNYNVMIGVINEATDSGTIDGIFSGIRYPATNRLVIGSAIQNGAATMDTAVSASARGIAVCITKGGIGSNAQVSTNSAPGIDAALARTAGGINANSLTQPSFGDTEPLICISFFRSATTAGTATGVFDFYGGVGVPARLST